MPSTSDDTDVPPEAVAVAERYRRIERPVSGAVALLAATAALAAFLVLSPVPGLLAALAVLGVVRAPAIRSAGTLELATDADSEAAESAFRSATPPALPLQWGIADSVRPTDGGGAYEVSYLFGLRSVRIEVESGSAPGDADLELLLTADGRPWATYTVSIAERDGRTAVDVEWESDRRFGLRRVPQWLVAERFRQEALAAQGYTVVERDATLTF